MLSERESFADYTMKFQASYCDGGQIIGQTDQSAVGSRPSRPFVVSEDGRSLIAPIYFHVLFSQTQKKPVTVNFYLEENGVAVSDWVNSPAFKVVSKPPMSVRAASANKRRKCYEGDSSDGFNEEEEGAQDSPADKYSQILSELQQIKGMMSAAKPDPETSNVGSSRPLKRKLEPSSESDIAKSIAALNHESMRHMLRELSIYHPESFQALVMMGSAMQIQISSSTMDNNFNNNLDTPDFDIKFE